jgi:integrase
MSKLNSTTTCDFIDFDKALNTGIKLMKEKKTELIGLYIIASIHTGLRTTDVKTITFEQIATGTIKLTEQKTKKKRSIRVNEQLIKATEKLSRNNKSGLIFLSQKNAVISTQQLNRLLKIVFASLLPTHCISTHSLRKTFGRRVYENNGRTEDALNYLSEIFNHASLRETRKYLGIRQEELNEIYLNL